MFSVRQLIYLNTLIFTLLSTVTSTPLEKRLDSGYSETGGSAAIEYTDPKTNILWIKNYHVRKSDGVIVEVVYRSDTGTWSSSGVGSAVTGNRNGGLAALSFINEADNTPVIHLFYDDLNTGYLKSVYWNTTGGWAVDGSYDSIASQLTNTARSAAAITFNYGVRTFQVFMTTASSTIARITWTDKTGWENEIFELVTTPDSSNNTLNRDIAAVVWGSKSAEISLFYALQVGTTGFWNIYEAHFSTATGAWTTPSHTSTFNNFHGVYGIGLAAVAWQSTSSYSIRLYAQGDTYVELGTDNLSTWTIRVLGNCKTENIIPQGQISVVHWMRGTNKNSLRYFQVLCTDAQCAFPVFQLKYYDYPESNNWFGFTIAIADEEQ